MATLNPAANGRKKTLADELDRFDAILDGLGEALTEAVAQAVREAVQAALAEPACARPCPAATSPPAAGRSWRDRLRRAGALVRRVIVTAVRWGRDAWGGPPADAVRRWAARAAQGGWRALARAGAALAGGFRSVPRLRGRGPAAAGVRLAAGFASGPAGRAAGGAAGGAAARRAAAVVRRVVSPPPAPPGGNCGGRRRAVPPPTLA